MRFALWLCVLVGCSAGEAPDSARRWAAENMPGAESVVVDCMSYDSDSNGYVSCTVVARFAGDPKPLVTGLECGVNHSGCGNSGCRARTR